MDNKEITLADLKPLSVVLGLDFEKTTVHERAKLRYEYIIKQRKEGNQETFWDYLEYIPCNNLGLAPESLPWFRKDILISDHGFALIKKYGKWEIGPGFPDGQGYPKISVLKENGQWKSILMHRCVASVFIPNDQLGVRFLINHKDNVKSNAKIANLEWCTHKENSIHAVDYMITGLACPSTKPVRGTWIIDDEHYGTSFIVGGKMHMKAEGLDQISIPQCAGGFREFVNGCKWEYVTEYDDDEVGVPENLIGLIHDKAYANQLTIPILGTVTKDCEIKGLEFVVYGGLRLKELGFDQGHVSRCCSGKLKNHGGCSWKKITRTEAKDKQRDLTPEQLTKLR